MTHDSKTLTRLLEDLGPARDNETATGFAARLCRARKALHDAGPDLAREVLTLRKRVEELSWWPIETCPKKGRFIARIHHGCAGLVEVEAEYHEATGGVFDVREESCVSWRPGYPPAFWNAALSDTGEHGDG